MLPGFEEPKAMVFVAAFQSIRASTTIWRTVSIRLCSMIAVLLFRKNPPRLWELDGDLGFLGTLHCSVFEDRLRQEHGASIIITPPTVPFKVIYGDGREEVIRNPADFPDNSKKGGNQPYEGVAELQEPYVLVTIALPEEYLGSVIELCQSERGEQKEIAILHRNASHHQIRDTSSTAC